MYENFTFVVTVFLDVYVFSSSSLYYLFTEIILYIENCVAATALVFVVVYAKLCVIIKLENL